MRRLVLAAAAVFACNNGDGQNSGFSTSITTAPPATTSTGAETTSTSTTGGSSTSGEDSAAASSTGNSDSSAGGIPDGGVPPDGGDKPPAGCKGKIDFMFTISSDWTMEDAQGWLKSSFPGFIGTLEGEFADFDYHILSANTSPLWGHPILCANCEDFCPEVPKYPCGVEHEPCDEIRGAGVTYPIGEHASNKRCDLASGRRYITSGQPELEDAFTCIASVGIDGAANVAEVTVKAVASELNSVGSCNAGFLRDDALLVVVVVQDTADENSEGTAQDWANALVDAKGGDADAVVLLVITNDIDDPDGLCGYAGIPPGFHELRNWTELLPHSVFGSICNEQGYAGYFAEAAAKIKTQCDVFVPQ
ncbi:hypothetical protein [Nannocystis bainbridge]|uniref:VWFA domain-containing protein n=1 Tax=Nannocystis bainbridge TaxID=2995303 RepID=A0ABT5E4Q7_9BACT|nr:hypothetical protein [Nannocystis bainbridge]MDC0720854.1 hypothetical protein [Nannocystis bainbridge]